MADSPTSSVSENRPRRPRRRGLNRIRLPVWQARQCHTNGPTARLLDTSVRGVTTVALPGGTSLKTPFPRPRSFRAAPRLPLPRRAAPRPRRGAVAGPAPTETASITPDGNSASHLPDEQWMLIQLVLLSNTEACNETLTDPRSPPPGGGPASVEPVGTSGSRARRARSGPPRRLRHRFAPHPERHSRILPRATSCRRSSSSRWTIRWTNQGCCWSRPPWWPRRGNTWDTSAGAGVPGSWRVEPDAGGWRG